MRQTLSYRRDLAPRRRGYWLLGVCCLPQTPLLLSQPRFAQQKRRKGAANDPIELLPPTAPAAILHLYRERVDAPLHAVGAELWVGQQRQQEITAMHCLGLTPGQIATHLQAVLQRLSEECERPLEKFAAQVELHPSQCPIEPCPLHKPETSFQPVAKQHSSSEPKPDLPLAKPKKVIKVRLWLRVENNSKFVRGKSKVRVEIEQWVLKQFLRQDLHSRTDSKIMAIATKHSTNAAIRHKHSQIAGKNGSSIGKAPIIAARTQLIENPNSIRR